MGQSLVSYRERMEVFDEQYFRLNKFLLSLIGLWPYQPLLTRIVLLIITVSSIGSLACAEGYVWVAAQSDWDLLIETLSPLLVDAMVLVKVVAAVVNTKKVRFAANLTRRMSKPEERMRVLIERMQKNWKMLDSSPRSDIMRSYAEAGRRMTIIYMVALYVAWWLYSTMPATSLLFEYLSGTNESLYLKPLYRYDYYLDVEKYQYYIFFHSMGAIFYIVTVIIASDSLFICLVQHICGLFSMLRYDIERIHESESLNIDVSPPLENDKAYHKLIKCIHGYNEALEFTDFLHDTYTILFLILVGIVMVDLSFTGAELALHADSFEQVVRFTAEAMAEIVHFYFNSLPCQRIIDHSLLVREALYSCRWYGISLQARKLLGFMLLRSTKPCIITAAHVYAMSMENFSSVLQASVSYFTMLTSMQ